MLLLKLLAAIYLIFGFLYAVYVTALGVTSWTMIPINTLGGPIVLAINYWRAKRGKLTPTG